MVGWSGGRVGWLDNWEIMLNSVQLSWKLTELGKNFLAQKLRKLELFKVNLLILSTNLQSLLRPYVIILCIQINSFGSIWPPNGLFVVEVSHTPAHEPSVGWLL